MHSKTPSRKTTMPLWLALKRNSRSVAIIARRSVKPTSRYLKDGVREKAVHSPINIENKLVQKPISLDVEAANSSQNNLYSLIAAALLSSGRILAENGGLNWSAFASPK